MKSEISQLKNLGGKCEIWLNEIGVHTRQDLAEIGAVEAWRRLRALGRPATMNFVYAVQGALLDMRWDQLPLGMKEDLKRRCGK